MKTWGVVLGCAVLVACSGPARRRRRIPRFQVETDSGLYEDAVAAAADWSMALGHEIEVSPTGDIAIYYVKALEPSCGGEGTWGCAYTDSIEILESIPRRYQKLVLMHEMGHVIRGRPGHIDYNDMAIMATPTKGRVITPDDVRFVTE